MFTNTAINYFKSKKIRITKSRKAILEIFNNSKSPESVRSVISKLAMDGIRVNKTTVYRELSFLIKEKLLKEVYTDPTKIHYEPSTLLHHHHLICTDCGKIDDFEMENEMSETERKIMIKKSFKVVDHSLEFFGLCLGCQ